MTVGMLVGLPLVWSILGEGPVRAESTASDLRHFWNFDVEKPGEAPVGFTAGTVGENPAGAWKIEADPQAPSAPNRLTQATPCPNAAEGECFQVLLADGIQYEYPDLTVRLRVAADRDGAKGGGGIVFVARDASNFYAAIVDLATDALEVVHVVDGKVTVLGREPVKRGKSPWHLLRVQHNTILSKDYLEIAFDGRIALTHWDKKLGAGQIGLATRGGAAIEFDSFHAIQLFSQRPLSPPAAY